MTTAGTAAPVADGGGTRERRAGAAPLGAVPLLAVLAAIGVLLVTLGDNAARSASGVAEPLFWTGLAAIYLPIAFRLLSPTASRDERIALVAVLSIALFLVKLAYSPLGFSFYDELGWWRATSDLLSTGHPFSDNPLVITTPGFPGLTLLTAPLSSLGHLSIFVAGSVTVAVVRTAFALALFLFFERATRSSRAAGIGVAIYACNPSFLYFNAQFAYESIALLLGLALLLVTVRWSESHHVAAQRGTRSLIAALAILACTLTVTHHMTSYAILGLLILWALLWVLGERSRDLPQHSLLDTPALPAIILGFTASAWFAFVAGGLTVTELGDVITGAIRSVADLFLGGSGPKRPFEAGGQSNTWLARGVAVVSVLALLLVIPAGLRRIWRPSASDPLQRALALVAVLYLVTLGLRLTHNGTETSQRASEFVFLGLAFLAAIVVARFGASSGGQHRARWALGVSALMTLVFFGGFIVGEPPQGRQPGKFLVSAERRSITPQGLAAAEFAAGKLPPGSRIVVDHANATLMASYGGLDPVMRRVDGIPVSHVFFGRNFTRSARRLVREGRISYIVVDRRLSESIPVGGYYFTRQEPGSFERTVPIRPASLEKFRDVNGLTKVYSNGAISIYDTAGMR